MSNVEALAKAKLLKLMQAVQPVIDQHLAEMQNSEIEYLLKNYRKFLKIDLERDLEKARTTAPAGSGIEDILKDYNTNA